MIISTAEILALQQHAFCSRPVDKTLVRLTYAALGLDCSVAMQPTTREEQDTAIQGCADQLEMFAAMGVRLLVEPPAPKWDPTLRSRAIAVLVVLRRGSLTPLEIRHRISDDLVGDTERLIVDMARHDAYQGRALIARCHGRWYLTGAAVEWLEGQGLTYAPEALIGYVQAGAQ